MHVHLLQAPRARASLCPGREAHELTICPFGFESWHVEAAECCFVFSERLRAAEDLFEHVACFMPEVCSGTRKAAVQTGKFMASLKFGRPRLLDAVLPAARSPSSRKFARTRKHSEEH